MNESNAGSETGSPKKRICIPIIVLGILLCLIGLACVGGGTYDHDFVSNQLKEQDITMPSGNQLTNQTMVDNLTQYAGQQMTTGPQALAFSDYYILEHMKTASGGKTYDEVSNEYITLSADPSADKSKVAALAQLRQTLFMGNTLRSILLSAYGWWTVGTIIIVVGWILAGLGLLSVIIGIFRRRNCYCVLK